MDKKKDSMKGMTSTQKAAVLRGKQRSNKDEMAKNDPRKTPLTGLGTKAEFDRRTETTNKLAQGNVDIGRTIARLDSSKDRSARSATYRLAKMKAEKKMSKESKMSKKANKFELSDGFRPTMNKALGLTKRGKKKK